MILSLYGPVFEYLKTQYPHNDRVIYRALRILTFLANIFRKKNVNKIGKIGIGSVRMKL